MEMTLDVRGLSYPSHLIATDDDHLFLDRRFRGEVYVKRMIRSALASKSRVFKFACNFVNGFGRDRHTLLDKPKEYDGMRCI